MLNSALGSDENSGALQHSQNAGDGVVPFSSIPIHSEALVQASGQILTLRTILWHKVSKL
jgi:hypothetical protein